MRRTLFTYCCDSVIDDATYIFYSQTIKYKASQSALDVNKEH